MPDDTEETMLAFVGTEVTRDELLASLEAHREADRIVQGSYWSGGRGCAIGCSIHDFRPDHEGEHGLWPDLFGGQESLAYLVDVVFEGLPEDEARDWPLRFWRAVQTGADLSRVTPAVLYRIVERRRDALADLYLTDDLRDEGRGTMDEVLNVLAEWRGTGEVDESAARSVWFAARYADLGAWSAARTVGFAAGHADLGAWSVALSAEFAAESAAAEKDEWRWIADALIEEIEAAPVREAA